MQIAAAVTMVRDDLFFLRAWLRHYGGLLGRENCYIVNHGRGAEVAALATGCNLIGIPGEPHKNFDGKRWQFLNNLVQGLRRYYTHIIVGDVDELVVLDPLQGNLLDWLENAPRKRVFTPLGLEVIHRTELEPDPPEPLILGPRRHARLAPHYSKPCIVSCPTKLSRGGHFAQYDKLHCPEGLYLMHLKFCDFDSYCAAMDRRNASARVLGDDPKAVAIGRHWFASERGEDRALFDSFAQLEMQQGFDLAWLRRRMQRSFGPRGETGYYAFNRPDYDKQYLLPERFTGLF